MSPPSTVAISLLCLLAAPVARAAGADPPWAVSQDKQLKVKLFGQFRPVAAATPSGDLYIALEWYSGPPPPASRQYGDTSKSGTLLYKLDSAGRLVFSVSIGGTTLGANIVADSAGNVYLAGPAAPAGLPVTTNAYLSTAGDDGPSYLCRVKADGTLDFCTYLNTHGLTIHAISTDPDGSIYVAGNRVGSAAGVMPTPGAVSVGHGNIGVLKLDASGSRLKYAAAFGGTGEDGLSVMTLGPGGALYFAGTTLSRDFPVTPDAAIRQLAGSGPTGVAAFMAVLNPAGSALTYVSYGWVGEFPNSLAVDSQANLYMAASEKDGSLCVRKYRGSGPGVHYERTFPAAAGGGPSALGFPSPIVLSIDEPGIASVVGTVRAANFPLHNPSQTCHSGNLAGLADGYLVRLSPSGDVLESTYLVGNGSSRPIATSIATGGGYIGAALFDTAAQFTGFAVMTLGPKTSGAAAMPFACVANAASLLHVAMSPGEIVSLFGEGIGPAGAASWTPGQNGLIPTTLAGTQITFDGVPAPILYAQASQINAITPWELTGKASTEVCVIVRGVKTNCIVEDVQPADPAIFTTDAGVPIAINQDGTINSIRNPAPVGSIVSIFATGIGVTDPIPPDGSISHAPLPSQRNLVQVYFPTPTGDQAPAAEVIYAGPAAFAPAGLTRIDFRVQRGVFYVQVTAPDGSQTYTQAFSIATVAP